MPNIQDAGGPVKLAKEHRQEGNNLRQRIGLAEDARLEVAQANAGIKNGGDHHNSQVSPKYQDRDAAGDKALVMQHEKQCAEQEFVRDRIEVLSKDSPLLQPSGEEAIQAIGNTCQYKQRKSAAVVAVKDGQHQEWNDAKAQKRKLVRSCAKLVHVRLQAAKKRGTILYY